jgi:protein TonB
MTKIVLSIVLVVCLFPGFTFAQQVVEDTNLPPKKIEYFNKDREKLPSAENAYYRVETTYREDASGTAREFYPSGEIKEIRSYAHVESKLRHGATTTWFENGKLQSKEDYFGGKQHGQRLSYYPDGTLRRREQFVNGERTSGECFGPDGKPVAYFEYMKMPTYPGGLDAMVSQIARNLRYPKSALTAQTQGKVFVNFVVGEDGLVRNAHITKGLSASLDREALRVVNELKKFTPGLLEGDPIPVSFTVPINFAIN